MHVLLRADVFVIDRGRKLMAVRIDKVLAPALNPGRPSALVWFLLLILCVLVFMSVQLLLLDNPKAPLPVRFWLKNLGGSFLIWWILLGARAIPLVISFGIRDTWRDMRQRDLAHAMQVGQRFQHVLAVSLHTALRDSDDRNGKAQVAALSSGKSAVRAQPSWAGEHSRHSHLAREEGDTPAQVIEALLTKLLAELAPALQLLPANKPVDLLLQITGDIPDDHAQALWDRAWRVAGIQQRAMRMNASGLAVVESRLDSDEQSDSLLLVVALQVAPAVVADSAEVAVGLLIGNVTSSPATPLAYLHRPEQEHAPSQAGLSYAINQALDWVPLEARAIKQIWSAGIGASRDKELATSLSELAMPLTAEDGMHRLDWVLGQPGSCAAWLAVGAAVEAASATARPQLTVSGEGVADQPLWCTVIRPFSND